MKKKRPSLKTDAEAEAFAAGADLTAYDLSNMVPMRFEMKPRDKSVKLRLPEALLKALQQGPR